MRRRRSVALLTALALLAALALGAAWVRLHGDAAGPVLQSVTLDQVPAAVAVDGRTERAFVIAACRAPPARVAGTLLDARSGTVLGNVAACGQAVAVDEQAGTVLVPGDGGVTVLDGASGRVLHTVAIAVAPDTIAADPRAGHVFVVDPGSDTVSMLDAHTGAILRTVSLVIRPLAVAVDEQARRVLVTSDFPFVAVLDTRSGALLHSSVVRAPLGPMAVDPRTGRAVVASGYDNTVRVLDTRSGRVLRSVDVGLSPVAVALDASAESRSPAGRAFVAVRGAGSPTKPMGRGSVVVLDARTGAIRQTIPLDVVPSALAFDMRSRHLLVAGGAGLVVEPDRWAWLPTWLRRWLPFLPPPGPQVRGVPPGVAVIDVR